MKAIFAVFAAAMLLAGCQASGGGTSVPVGNFDDPVAPGVTRLDFNPDRERWQIVRRENARITRGYYVCRSLACEKPTAMVYSNGPSPTRKPDPAAIKALAETMIAKKREEGASNISQRIAPLQGYPAIWMEYTIDKDGKSTEQTEVQAFVGSAVVGILTGSSDRKVAKRHLDEAVKILRIKDGGAAPRP